MAQITPTRTQLIVTKVRFAFPEKVAIAKPRLTDPNMNAVSNNEAFFSDIPFMRPYRVRNAGKPKNVTPPTNEDTIGILALDDEGKMAGGCTTSGLAYKMHGRVGDSPILGAGLFVDPEVGGATATGLGEAVMKTVGSFLVVELMRQGRSPQDACEEAVHRIMERMPTADLQVGYLALGKDGSHGAHAIHGGFNYALTTVEGGRMIDATHG